MSFLFQFYVSSRNDEQTILDMFELHYCSIITKLTYGINTIKYDHDSSGI